MPEPPQIKLTLRADGVVAPALRAIVETIETINFCLTSIDEANLSKPPEYAASRFHLSFDRSYISTEARKTAYANWLLCRGFQELARSIRQMLEEAFFYNSMVRFSEKNLSNPKTWGMLQERMREFRKTAADANFPDLIKLVNQNLSAPLFFEKEFFSLQKVRNCLEHRDGIVTERDIDPKSKTLRLSLPRLKIYCGDGGKEIELGKGSFIEADTVIKFKQIIEEREYRLGEKISFNPAEFHDIGFGCWAFTRDLGAKLPKLETPQ